MTEGAGPLRILVVDDEPALRFLRAGLGSQGYVLLEAETGQKALDAVRNKRPDIVVLDLGLPDIDGLQVISAPATRVRRFRSSCCPVATTRLRRCRRWISGQMTM